jgi:hypothetical protein
MTEEWTQTKIEQEYIYAQAEESTTLEYKAADALGTSDGKKKEITRDVSALANAAGGIVIYGIKEYNQPDKKHLPEKVDPVDRALFSKEWLEQVINNIRPRIEGLVVLPVPVNEDTRPNEVVYIVKVPQSTTAHQASDLKYYRRYNFERLAMQDHEIRDVMNRGAKPNAEVEFSWKHVSSGPGRDWYRLGVIAKNQGLLVIEHFKLEFTFPDLDEVPLPVIGSIMPTESVHSEPTQQSESKLVDIEVKDSIAVSVERGGGLIYVNYRSTAVLFPNDKRVIDKDINLKYAINNQVYAGVNDVPALEWILYADSMQPKHGTVPFSRLCGLQ